MNNHQANKSRTDIVGINQNVVQQPKRALTVDEALQRTPMTSINPFNPETIPTPSAIPARLCTSSLNSQDRASAKVQLEKLDASVQQSESGSTSARLEQTLKDLHFLLKSEDYTKYEFPSSSLPPPSNTTTPRQSSAQNEVGAAPTPSSQPVKIGALARKLLSTGAFDSSYRARPTQPESKPPVQPPNPVTTPRSSGHVQNSLANSRAFNQNAQPYPIINGAGISSQSPSSTPASSSAPIVIVPPQPKDEKSFVGNPKADREMLRELKSPSKTPVRKIEASNELLREVDIDSRERARVAVQTLGQLLSAIYEADDIVQATGSLSENAQQHFTTARSGDQHILTSSSLSKVDSAFTKVTSTKQSASIPIEDLIRLQKTCARSLESIADEDLALPDDTSGIANEQLVSSTEAIENAMAASRLLLRTMTAGRKEKELYSEGILDQFLTILKQVVEGWIVPLAERRASSDTGKLLSRDKALTANLVTITQRVGRVVRLVGDLLLSSELSEMAVSTIDFICTKLVFVANASTEKESILGVQKFEGLRRNAMDALTRVFFRAPSLRTSILNEILFSLEKLPVARQSARHYKIVDGKPIQLVSALIMQLVQTTATRLPEKTLRSNPQDEYDGDSSDQDSSSDETHSEKKPKGRQKPNGASSMSLIPSEQLASVGKPIWASVQNNASHVAEHLINRALKSSKTGDEPYRNLLDIFTEDFLSVLGHIEWPGAELILQSLLRRLIGIVENDKSSAPAKNMALDLMGTMGSGVADVKNWLERVTPNLESEDEHLAQRLGVLASETLNGQNQDTIALSIDGPYRAVLDHLSYRAEDDVQLQNAHNYHLLQWSQKIWMQRQASATPASDGRESPLAEGASNVVAKSLLSALQKPANLCFGDSLQVSTSIARASYLVVVLNSTFCKAKTRMLHILLQSMGSQHATIRSRGLKSVIQLLENDPTMLDRNALVVRHLIKAADDQSTMVRDAALGLVGKCITLRPSVDAQFLDTVLALCSDSAVGIRKRSIPHLKDIYLRNKDDKTRIRIASAFLRRMDDEEESVIDLARQTLEAIWIEPYPVVNEANLPVSIQQELSKHAAQLVTIAEQSQDVLHAFEPFFHRLLTPSHKNANANRDVCKAITNAAFESFIENDQTKGLEARANILALLSVLAHAHPALVTVDQLKMLEAYTKTLKTGADLRLFKPVTQIFRGAMPCLSSTDRDFLLQLQGNLVRSLSLIPPTSSDLLDEVTGCLWEMNGILDNKEQLVKICQSVLIKILQDTEGTPQKLLKLIKMVGYFGKAWDLDDYASNLHQRFTWWEGDSIADLIVQTLLPVSNPASEKSVRRAGLESICLTCLSWPQNFLKKDVIAALHSAFQSRDSALELVVITGLRDFFKSGETQPKAADGKAPENGEKLGSSMISSDHDKAATLLAQHFFGKIQNIALRYTDEVGLSACELICSTNRQGLVHPRQSGYALVALETSPNKAIAKAAYDEHLSLNSKHESILEKEYLKAIEQAYRYQKDIVGDLSGLDHNNQASPKLGLFFEVLKSSSLGTRKKFLPNLCKRLDVNISKVDSLQAADDHYLFAKFVCQNLAFASYGRVDEVTSLCSTLESIFGVAGNTLSQELEPILNTEPGVQASLENLPKLTRQSMLLCLIWQTRCHLRSVYTNLPLTSGKNDKRVNKDTSKAPMKSTNAPKLEEAYLKTTESVGFLTNEQAMRDQCQRFMDVFSTDHEAKITNGDEELENGRMGTPEDDETSMASGSQPPSGSLHKHGAKRRRSESNSAASTPSGRKRGRPRLEKRRSSTLNKAWQENDNNGWD